MATRTNFGDDAFLYDDLFPSMAAEYNKAVEKVRELDESTSSFYFELKRIPVIRFNTIADIKKADGIKYMTFYNSQFSTEFFRITFIKRERKSRPYITRINTETRHK